MQEHQPLINRSRSDLQFIKKGTICNLDNWTLNKARLLDMKQEIILGHETKK